MSLLVALATHRRKNDAQLSGQEEAAELPSSLRTTTQRQHHLTPAERDELAAARRAGAEINELAERYDVHRSTVMANLDRAGVPARRRQGRSLSPDQLQAAGRLYASGLNLNEVGERFNVDRRYLRRALPDAGFPLRLPGRQPGR